MLDAALILCYNIRMSNTLKDILASQIGAFVQYPLSYSPTVNPRRHPAQARRMLQAGDAVQVSSGGVPALAPTRNAALAFTSAEKLDAALAARAHYNARMGWQDPWLSVLSAK